MISHQSFGGAFLGDGYPSNNQPDHWLVETSYEGKPYGSFDFFKRKFALKMTEDNFDGSLPAQDGVYYSADRETLNNLGGNWHLTGQRWLVIIVKGDVDIPFNILVDQGSFLAIASSGKITFSRHVTQAQGVFVAQTIDTSEGNLAFEGQGIFAAKEFKLQRDFADARNQTTPVETFIARPDFILSSYRNKEENLWWSFHKWKELAP